MAITDLQELVAAQQAANTPQTAKRGTHETVYDVETGEKRELYRIDAREQLARGLAAQTAEQAAALKKAAAKGKPAKATAKAEPAETVKPEEPAEHSPLTSVKGIGEKLAARLAEYDLGTPEQIRAASDEDLAAVDGVSESVIAGLRAWSEE